jgi:MobA/MobL family
VHVMFSERRHDGIDRGPDRFFRRANPDAPARGGAAKDPAWNHRDKVAELRSAWAETANRALERAGLDIRIDHRSLEAQGIDRLPEPKLGPERTAMLRRGIETPESAQVLDLRAYRERLGRVERAVEHAQGQVIDLAQARAEREARAREQAERPAQEQAREQAEREEQERTRSDRLTPEEAARVEQLIAREPAWRAEQDAARIERLMARLENPEARIEALLQREQAWRAAQLEQARQQLEHATGQVHTFAQTARVAGRLVDRVELAGEDFGRVRDRDNHLVLVPWTREMGQHLGRSVTMQLDAGRQVTRVLAEAPRRERDLGLDRGG